MDNELHLRVVMRIYRSACTRGKGLGGHLKVRVWVRGCVGVSVRVNVGQSAASSSPAAATYDALSTFFFPCTLPAVDVDDDDAPAEAVAVRRAHVDLL
jgi:hypothetical protein